MMDTKEVLLQWFVSFLIRRLDILLIKRPALFPRINNYLLNDTSASLENFRGIKYTPLLKILYSGQT